MTTCTRCGLNAELDDDMLCGFCYLDILKEETDAMLSFPKKSRTSKKKTSESDRA